MSNGNGSMAWNRLTVDDIQKCDGHTITIDVETTGLHFWNCHIIGVGLHVPTLGLSGYIPTLTPTERLEVVAAVNQLGGKPNTVLVGHNMKFEMHFLNFSEQLKERVKIHDTTSLVHLLDSRYKKNLAECERIFLRGSSKKSYSMMVPKSQKSKIWEWPLDVVAPYCVNDCIVEHKLYETLVPQIQEMDLWDLFKKDMAYLKVLHSAEQWGMKIDVPFVQEAREAMDEHVLALEQDLYDMVGYKFNWRSPQQLSKALYDDMGVKRPKNPFADADGVDRSKFAGRLYSGPMTSTFLLMEKVKHPAGGIVSQLREAAILGNTLGKWLKLRDEDDIIHPNFNLTGTRTSRLSCSEPNVQNVASQFRTKQTQSVYSGEDGAFREKEYNLRHAFIARPGYVHVSTDYSQMEIRMFGLLSRDPFMLDSLARGSDIHADIAEKVWGVRDKLHREWSKTISFGLIYGLTTGSLQHRLNMTHEEAKRVTNDYWKAFPRIQPWLHDIEIECQTNGYVRYWSGRRWYEEDKTKMYVGANAVVQGGSAEVLSIAAIRLHRWYRENMPSAHIVSFVHDEIISEVPKELAITAAENVERIMSAPDLFDLPWKVASKIGDSYGTLEDISGYEF